MPFYQRGGVRIRYEETGAGFPLLVTPGGGLTNCVEPNTRLGLRPGLAEIRQERPCRWTAAAGKWLHSHLLSPTELEQSGTGVPHPCTAEPYLPVLDLLLPALPRELSEQPIRKKPLASPRPKSRSATQCRIAVRHQATA